MPKKGRWTLIQTSDGMIWNQIGQFHLQNADMAPVRLRHPKGVSTLQIPLDDDNFSVQDFQQQIRSVTDILPSRQAGGLISGSVARHTHLFRPSVKTGYPPRSLTLVPELPFSSLGIKSGDQVIVSEIPGPSGGQLGTTPVTANAPPPPLNDLARPHTVDPAGVSSLGTTMTGPDCVDTADGGVLVHRVRLCSVVLQHLS